jgi:hypothetical protein
MSDYYDSHVEVEYLNKPFFVQLKRVWRKVKTLPEQEKPKKLGFFLQMVRGLEGSAIINEKIVKDIFGTFQQMAPQEFIKKIFSFEIPLGKKTFVKHETNYQQTQRLVAGWHEDSEKIKSIEQDMPPRKFGVSGGKKQYAPLNKTIQVSIFGDIYEEILKKYKTHPQSDQIIRAINSNLTGHFTNAAAFVRWTKFTPSWIHIDAFQTDFFNKIKAMKFAADQKGDELSKEVANDFRKYEDEFFKAAVSYMIRSNPEVKMFTANTEDLVKAIEHVKGDVKLKEYYYKLPKMLGFRTITLSDLEKKFHLSQEKSALEKHFKTALSEITHSFSSEEIINWLSRLKIDFTALQKDRQGKEITKEEVDEAVAQADMPAQIVSAVHQFIDELTEVVNGRFKRKEDGSKMGLAAYLTFKRDFIKDFISQTGGPGAKIWWADKRMLFESTHYENRMVIEQILEMVRS